PAPRAAPRHEPLPARLALLLAPSRGLWPPLAPAPAAFRVPLPRRCGVLLPLRPGRRRLGPTPPCPRAPYGRLPLPLGRLGLPHRQWRRGYGRRRRWGGSGRPPATPAAPGRGRRRACRRRRSSPAGAAAPATRCAATSTRWSAAGATPWRWPGCDAP